MPPQRPPLDVDPHVVPHRFATADLPGIGGVIKQRPEDFFVEEQPLYAPSGEGEHIYMLIEKINMSTFELVSLVATHFGVARHAVGYAGLKDKPAITRQVISVHAPGRTADDFAMIQHDRVRVLWTDQHTNKLRTGHLAGNRFSIRIRNVDMSGAIAAKRVIDRLAREGVPNRVGEQRFGGQQNNHLIGQAMIVGDFQRALDLMLGPNPRSTNPEAREYYARGEFEEAAARYPRSSRAELTALKLLARGKKPAMAFKSIEETFKKFFLSAFQSAAFNAVLDERLERNEIGMLRDGDLAFKHDSRAIFDVDQSVLDAPDTAGRLERFEISPSGPMWGWHMPRARGETARVEEAALARLGVTLEQLAELDRRAPSLLEGARRPLRVPLIDPDVEGGIDEHGHFVRVAFELPRGSFATVVLREIMKPGGESTIETAEIAAE